MSELVDTTEMYLKSIYEMLEDGVPPMRARIVERLGHSGPTVSQTVARMERDGYVALEEDRRIALTKKGVSSATEVVRKHRLAERLLTDVIGLQWELAHEEACRWEHVMSEQVEALLIPLLNNPQTDPYGNPIPEKPQAGKSVKAIDGGVSLETFFRKNPRGGEATILRIGEPSQAVPGFLFKLAAAKMLPGSKVSFSFDSLERLGIALNISAGETADGSEKSVEIPELHFKHFFVKL
ncbi:metal-dependent transcriptional regulator [Mobiluncus mulieris]|uniref:Metal-dependent transcriptional regulator n=1 Tax=Mobiluncus mulieris TaxID=2052 RepID=A0A7Y0Y3C9_9ACTO|nr:metal-dependent transcriptional regulator [Mobiluncus mulieris]NMW64291.1 metal-dependent transcriptional regulator [Mobiluncus mulieris]